MAGTDAIETAAEPQTVTNRLPQARPKPCVPAGASARITAATIAYERIRAVASGLFETATQTFLLLIALRHFQAGETLKGLISSGLSLGLLASPFAVHLVRRLGWTVARGAALLTALGGLCLTAAAYWQALPVFVAGCVLGQLCLGALIPLLTQMYQDNYPEDSRGRIFSSITALRISAAMLFAFLFGRLLNADLAYWPVLVALFGAALLLSAYCLARCPSGPLRRDAHAGLFHAFHWLRDDPLFLKTLLVWMCMGFANLIMGPLRTDYLANAKYELNYGPAAVAWLMVILPNAVRLVLNPVWGRLFDRANFFRLRLAINASFALGILAFFTGSGLPGLVLGAVFYGVAMAGGDVAWSLWVTKLAPPERVAEYMSIHTFFTGVRGAIAPLLAFHLAAWLPLWGLGGACALLILLASLLLLPEARGAGIQRRQAPLTEDHSE